MEFDKLLTPFLAWQFIVAAFAINALLIYIKRFVNTASPDLLQKRWFKSILTIANLILGVLVALVPNFLYGARFAERAFVGVCAGFLSHFIYTFIIKRFLQKKTEDSVVVDDLKDVITKEEKKS